MAKTPEMTPEDLDRMINQGQKMAKKQEKEQEFDPIKDKFRENLTQLGDLGLEFQSFISDNSDSLSDEQISQLTNLAERLHGLQVGLDEAIEELSGLE